MNRKTKIIVSVCAAILVIALGAFTALQIWGGKETTEGVKNITVEVIWADGSSEIHEIETDAEYLRQALEQENLIAGIEDPVFGLMVDTVAGVKADSARQQWWKFSLNGVDLMTGVDQAPVSDGDHYEITLMTGYDDFF